MLPDGGGTIPIAWGPLLGACCVTNRQRFLLSLFSSSSQCEGSRPRLRCDAGIRLGVGTLTGAMTRRGAGRAIRELLTFRRRRMTIGSRTDRKGSPSIYIKIKLLSSEYVWTGAKKKKLTRSFSKSQWRSIFSTSK